MITGKTQGKAWRNHPALHMWANYPTALMYYHDLCVQAWINRSYVNNMPFYRQSWLDPDYVFPANHLPWWLGKRRLHSSHRAALLFKQPGYYWQFKWSESPEMKYWWPGYGDEDDNFNRRTHQTVGRRTITAALPN